MNKNEKKKSNSGIIFAIIFILIGIIGNLDFGSGSSGAASVIVFVFVIIFVAMLLVAIAKAKKTAAGSKAKTNTPPTKKPQAAPVKTAAPERKYYDSDCERQSSEHEHNRRLEQLDTFLKDGIIGREEYNILKAKYMR